MNQLLLPSPTTLSVSLPFSGFYGSRWEQAYDYETERRLEWWQNDFGSAVVEDLPGLGRVPYELIQRGWPGIAEVLWDASDYSTYTSAVAKEYADTLVHWIGNSLQEAGLILTREIPFEYECMQSPRFYNFETNRVFAKMSLSTLQTMLDTLLEQGSLLSEVVVSRHRSRSGFCSFYSDDLTEWQAKPLVEWDHNELGTLVCAWVKYQGVENLDEEMDEYGSLYEFCSNAWSSSVDWPKLAALSETLADELLEEAGVPEEERPIPRCTATLELPL